jgi:hypothetical protein
MNTIQYSILHLVGGDIHNDGGTLESKISKLCKILYKAHQVHGHTELYSIWPASLEVDLGEALSRPSETFSREVNRMYWCAPSCSSAARNLLATAKGRLTGPAFDRRRLFLE